MTVQTKSRLVNINEPEVRSHKASVNQVLVDFNVMVTKPGMCGKSRLSKSVLYLLLYFNKNVMASCTNTPVKKYFRNADICINCGSYKREKRRIVTRGNLELLQKLYGVNVGNECQTFHFCKDCFPLTAQYDAAQKKIEKCCTELVNRGKDGPLQNQGILSKKRARKPDAPASKANKRREQFPKTPTQDTPNKTTNVVVKTKYKNGSRRISHPKGIYKKAIKNLALKRIKTALNVMVRDEQGRKAAVELVCNLIKKETSNLCRVKTSSILRYEKERLLEPSPYSSILHELQDHCPLSYTVLLSLGSKKKNPTMKEFLRLAVVWAILLFNQNRRMHRVQVLNSLLLYQSCTNQKLFRILNEIGVCASYKTTLKMVDKLCENHDQRVKELQKTEEQVVAYEQVPDQVVVFEQPMYIDHHVMQMKAGSPSYQIVFDNLNWQKVSRFKNSEESNQRYDVVQGMAVVDRISFEHLADDKPQADVLSLPNYIWLPSKEEHSIMRTTLKVLVQRTLCEQMQFFKENFQDLVIDHIEHQYTDQSTLKSEIIPLGLLNKNEVKTEDMVDIMSHYQNYCPVVNGRIKPIILGGDGLTCERAHDAWLARSDGITEEDKLNGLIIKAEDWHKNAIICRQNIFNQHYLEMSSRDPGTLYQLKIRPNNIGKGVKKKVKDAVNDCGEFLRITTKSYVVLAVMHLLDMTNPNDTPAENTGLLNKDNRIESFDKIALSIIDKYVLDNEYDPEAILKNEEAEIIQPERPFNHQRVLCGYPQCPKTFAVDGLVRSKHRNICIYKDLIPLADTEDEIEDNLARVPCGYPGCNKSYAGKGRCWEKHRENCCNKPKNQTGQVEERPVEKEETKKEKQKEDHLYNYSCSILKEGLLDWAREDATKENDGDRAFIYWKYDLMDFHKNGNIKYRILSFDLIAKILATLPPRMAASIQYNRCLNVNGGKGRNIACDQALEFLNKKCKKHLSNCNVVTDKVLKRVGHSIGPLKLIEESVDKEIEFYSNNGRRVHPSYSQEISSITIDLIKYNLFDIPGRRHEAFPNFKNTIALSTSINGGN